MTRPALFVAVVLLFVRVASAQPAPAEQPPDEPAPAEEPAAPAAEPKATEPTPAVEDSPLKSPEPKADEPSTVSATYDGGLKLSTADDAYELKIQFRTQMRFEANRPLDSETPIRHNQFSDRFYIARARMQAEGNLFSKDNRYKLELGLGDQGSFSFVKDLFMEKRLPDSPLYVRFGQWKRPFNRAELVSDFASTFNERSIQNELAGGGRDLGIAIHNDYEKSPEGLEWVVGMFNGFSGASDRPAITTACVQDSTTMAITCVNTRPSTFPADFGPTMVVRGAWNSPGMKGYSEGDLEGGPLRYSVGAAYKVDLANFHKQNQMSWGENMSHGLEVDANIKAMGYALHAGVVVMKIKSRDAEYGFFLQPGMMIVPKKVEVAARFALTTLTETNPAGGSIGRNQIEARAALNYFWQGHTWKLASDGGFLVLTGDQPSEDKPDLQFRVMMQLSI